MIVISTAIISFSYSIPFSIDGREYTFASEAGIFHHDPKNVPTAKFRETISMGVYNGTTKDLEITIDELKRSFQGSDYNVLTKNCNCFAEALVQKLLGKSIPGYVNRMAEIGSYFSCLLPPSITNQAPVDSTQESNNLLVPSSKSRSSGVFSGKGYKLGGALTPHCISNKLKYCGQDYLILSWFSFIDS